MQSEGVGRVVLPVNPVCVRESFPALWELPVAEHGLKQRRFILLLCLPMSYSNTVSSVSTRLSSRKDTGSLP